MHAKISPKSPSSEALRVYAEICQDYGEKVKNGKLTENKRCTHLAQFDDTESCDTSAASTIAHTLIQDRIGNFVNPFGEGTSRTMLNIFGCTASFKLIYPIVKSPKDRSRCAKKLKQLSFDRFHC